MGDDPEPDKKWTRPAELLEMPPGEFIDVEGEKLRCYTLEEGVRIARLANQHRDLFNAAIRWEGERAVFEDKIGGLELRLNSQIGLVQEHKDNADYYRELWKTTRVELHDTYNIDKWRWLPWVLPTLMGIAWGISSSFN